MSNTAQGLARDRILSLLDENSFVEVGALITKRNTDFNLLEKEVPADGVITGYGVIENKLVYVYSQDAKALHGTIGEMHAKKIAHLYDLALKVGAPVIGLIDCAGIRLQEATDALAGFGELYLKQTMASGVVPQITAVFGSCGGGVAVSSALSDFTFMEAKKAKMFVNSPNALDGNYIAKNDTSSAAFQGEAGVVDFVGEEDGIMEGIRNLIQLLPSNNEDDATYEPIVDDMNREVEGFDTAVVDPSKALSLLADQNLFVEVKQSYAKDMVVGFLRLNGMTVGAVANRSAILDDEYKAVEKFDKTLSVDGCKKAADFVTFCDAFGIPVVTLTNVTGYKATIEEEKNMAVSAAKLTYAFASATVPKINVVVGKAFGSAYVTMNSKHIGADMVFAFPDTEIGMMEAKHAVQIMYAEEIKTAEDKLGLLATKEAEYQELQSSPVAAAKRGYIDTIIEPESTRKQLIYAFDMLFTKREVRPSKKHGTV